MSYGYMTYFCVIDELHPFEYNDSIIDKYETLGYVTRDRSYM